MYLKENLRPLNAFKAIKICIKGVGQPPTGADYPGGKTRYPIQYIIMLWAQLKPSVVTP